MGSGFNLIFLPDKQDNRDFRVQFNATRETLVVAPIGGPIPNRGSIQDDIEFFGVHYFQRVTDAFTNEALHVEPGLWLNVPATTVPPASAFVVRQASIPHGDSLLAIGQSASSQAGPQIDTIDSTPVNDGGGPFKIGYLDPFLTAPLPPGVPADAKRNPNAVLTAAIQGQSIVNTITLTISAAKEGMVNIPFVEMNATPMTFTAVFWIETVKNSDGSLFMQLQYSQIVNLHFAGATWPHISVATLVKQ